ncbi:MAG: hypothetical protein QGH01_04210, partial [Alphaproteobacteria bacterium]|nr:hypothetical protein [Alphaproteobacteria bacterium]
IWSKGLPEAVKPLKSDHPMVAGKYGYYWECHDGTVSMDLEAIWGMSVSSCHVLKRCAAFIVKAPF